MLLAFLRAESASERFADDLQKAMEKLGAEETLLSAADLTDAAQNALRREVMGEFRGYGREEELFTRYPKRIDWKYAELEAEDLGRIRYIDYSYWNEISCGTSSPLDAVRTIRAGRRIFDVPNDGFLAGERFLRDGGRFPPVILLTAGSAGPHIILEGHLRMTAYALAPEYFAGTHAYVGFCSGEELKNWNTDMD